MKRTKEKLQLDIGNLKAGIESQAGICERLAIESELTILELGAANLGLSVNKKELTDLQAELAALEKPQGKCEEVECLEMTLSKHELFLMHEALCSHIGALKVNEQYHSPHLSQLDDLRQRAYDEYNMLREVGE